MDKLILGDSIEIIKSFSDDSIHAIISDIPYGIGYADWDVLHDNKNTGYGGASSAQLAAGKLFGRRGKPLNGWSEADKKIPLEYQNWCSSWAPDWLRILKPGGSCFIFAGRRYAHRCVTAMEDAGFTFKDMLSWEKDTAPQRAQKLSVIYKRRGDEANEKKWTGWRVANLKPLFEPILWFQKPYKTGGTIADNVLEHKVGAWNEAAVQKYNIPADNNAILSNMLKVQILSTDHGKHIAQKPLQLLELLVSLVTIEGQVVLDPFMGSGTTCLAAKKLHRQYIGIDIDPHCVQTADERLNSPVQTELTIQPEAPKLSKKLADWCGLRPRDRMVLVTDQAQKGIAEILQAESLFALEIVNYQEEFSSRLEALKALGPEDLVVVALSLDSFTGCGANRFFSPFSKPEGLDAKYAFLRLDITPESLLQGLSTAPELVYGKIAQMAGYEDGAPLRVQNPAGTELTLRIHPFTTCSHRIEGPGGMAFLPPSETSAEVVPGSGDGKIIIDITVGQLYHFGELLGDFGLVDRPVTLTLAGGVIQDITGGPMARELKEKLFALPEDCRRLTELGQGLSDLDPTGLIGVDESILHSCHFGFGDGGCGTHLDLVLSSPVIRRQ